MATGASSIRCGGGSAATWPLRCTGTTITGGVAQIRSRWRRKRSGKRRRSWSAPAVAACIRRGKQAVGAHRFTRNTAFQDQPRRHALPPLALCRRGRQGAQSRQRQLPADRGADLTVLPPHPQTCPAGATRNVSAMVTAATDPDGGQASKSIFQLRRCGRVIRNARQANLRIGLSAPQAASLWNASRKVSLAACGPIGSTMSGKASIPRGKTTVLLNKA